MIDYSKVAFYDLRKVLWEEIRNANLLDPNDYYADGFSDVMVPIIPAQQIPEINNLLPGKSYIVYDISQRPISVNWWMQEEVATLNVVSRNPQKIQAIINMIIDVFRRYDKSAGEVQLQVQESSVFKFHYFKIESADPVQAFADEGGFMSGVVSIGYGYTRELDPVTGRMA